MKICFLGCARSTHTLKWVRFFANKGHDVHLVSDSTDQCPLENVTFHNLYRPKSRIKYVSGLRSMLPIVSTIRKIKPDILHAHFVTNFGFFAALTGVTPFVLTAWGSDILIAPKQSRRLKYMVQWTLKRANLITCDAGHMVERMVELGADRESIKVIYFGVDTKIFTPARKNPSFYQDTLQLPTGAKTIISLRSLNPVYDLETLIRAIPLVLPEVPDSVFIIAGDGEQKEYLKNLAQELEVGEKVRFIGPVPFDRMPDYLASADIYVSTSLSDGGIASSTAEAMACGLPVVVTDFGENARWVEQGKGGFVFPLRSPSALAQHLVFLLKNEVHRRAFGEYNRRVIEDRNNYDKEMQKVDDMYHQLKKDA